MRSTLVPLVVCLGSAVSALGADPAPVPRLVSQNDLANMLNDPGIRLLDVRPKDRYAKSHIPGAVWVDAKAAEKLASSRGGLDDEKAWEAWIKPLGIDGEAPVLIYGDDRQLSPARFWWLLSYLGVPDVGLVDGNYSLWTKDGRTVTGDVPAVAPYPFDVKFRSDLRATKADIRKALEGKDAKPAIVDARSADEHTGKKLMSKRGGRIPGACHVEWTTLVDADGRFLPADPLHAHLEKMGIRADRPVVTHCQGGGRASVDAFALRRLGIPAKNYYPGWSEWGNDDELPVEKP